MREMLTEIGKEIETITQEPTETREGIPGLDPDPKGESQETMITQATTPLSWARKLAW